MCVKHERALLEVQLQLELDEERGVPPLAPRARALQQARASGDEQAQRQALIDLAAACIAIAARLPAPTHALDELELRTTDPRLARPTKKRSRRSTSESSKPGTTARSPRPRRSRLGVTIP
jgi:hypothetical protein